MPDQKSRNLDSHNGKSRYVDASRRVRGWKSIRGRGIRTEEYEQKGEERGKNWSVREYTEG